MSEKLEDDMDELTFRRRLGSALSESRRRSELIDQLVVEVKRVNQERDDALSEVERIKSFAARQEGRCIEHRKRIAELESIVARNTN